MNPFPFVLDLTETKGLKPVKYTTHNTHNNGDKGCDSIITKVSVLRKIVSSSVDCRLVSATVFQNDHS